MNHKILTLDELERFRLSDNPKFNQILEKSRRSLKEEGGLKSDEFWKLVDESSTQESQQH
ncbi:hypothetical protein [Microseira wollei]|uniref:Uncharacterized protein n=1 Tax=Microseira wollei NIES-4236 TaxID=2530354 RepID=A0AAV3XJQ1_9CYAN|nr:hypothetical protein [Microseira wollei]GET41818.1 hypothetical protein MiSe_66320 [Microseira wollei NIES-4236]